MGFWPVFYPRPTQVFDRVRSILYLFFLYQDQPEFQVN